MESNATSPAVQQQNNDIVDQFREYLDYILKGKHPQTFYGYSLALHVDSGVIPILSGDGSYLSYYRNLLREDMTIYAPVFENHIEKLQERKTAERLLNYQCGIKCVLSTPDKTRLFANVLFPSMELDKYITLVTRLLSFLQHLSVKANVTLSTVVITCAALKQKFFHLSWMERELAKPLPVPLTLHDFSRPLTVYEEDYDI